MWIVGMDKPVVSAPKAVFAGHDDELTAVAVTKKSEPKLVVTVCKKGVVKLWAYDGSVCFQTMSVNDKVECLTVSSNDRFLAAGTRKGTVTVWSLEAWQIGHQITTSHLSDDSVVCSVFTMDEKYLICGMHMAKNQLYMWDFQDEGEGSR